MTDPLSALVDAALADEHDLDDALDQLDAAVLARPLDPSLRRLRLRLNDAAGYRAAQVEDYRALCGIDPTDRDAALTLCRMEYRWAWLLAAPENDHDSDHDHDSEEVDDEAAARAVQAVEDAAGQRLLALTQEHLADADWMANLLCAWPELPLAANIVARLRLTLQARASQPQHPGLRHAEALAWLDFARSEPTIESTPDQPPMGMTIGPHGELTDALAAERALAAMDAAPPSATLAEMRAELEQSLCRFATAAAAWDAAAALWRDASNAATDESDAAPDRAAEAERRASLCRAGRAALVASSVDELDDLMSALEVPATGVDLPEGAQALLTQLQSQRRERMAGLRSEIESLRPALTATAAEPDGAELEAKALAIAAQILGAVPTQRMEWVPHDGTALDPRLLAAQARWRALGLLFLGWTEVPLYSMLLGAPTVGGLWTTADHGTVLLHIATLHLETVDLETELDDGRQFLTSLGRGQNFMSSGPRVDTLHLDRDADMAEVLALHSARVALAAGGVAMRPVRSIPDLEAMLERQRLAKLAWRRETGLSEFEALGVPVEPSEQFAPRLTSAVRKLLKTTRI